MSYGTSSEEESDELQNSPKLISSSSLVPTVNTTAPVEIKEDVLKMVPVDPHSKELVHNPRFDQLFAPKVFILMQGLAFVSNLSCVFSYLFRLDPRTHSLRRARKLPKIC